MKLSNIALLALRGTDVSVKEKIAAALSVSMKSIYRYMDTNDDNLTKAAVLKVIREETGLTDQEILEDSVTEEAQN